MHDVHLFYSCNYHQSGKFIYYPCLCLSMKTRHQNMLSLGIKHGMIVYQTFDV